MSEFSYPEDAGSMVNLIVSRADASGELRAAVEAAATDLASAERNLAAARERLAAHEATAPDADPAAWAARKRELFDVIPVFEGIAAQRAAWLKQTKNALGYELSRICDEIDMGLTSASRRAYGDAHLIARKMFAAAEKVERGDTDACRATGAARAAYGQAIAKLGLV